VTITAQKVAVRVLPTPILPAETVAVMPDNLVYAADGTVFCPIGELVKLVLNAPDALRLSTSRCRRISSGILRPSANLASASGATPHGFEVIDSIAPAPRLAAPLILGDESFLDSPLCHYKLHLEELGIPT
jgi:hypothetical protein